MYDEDKYDGCGVRGELLADNIVTPLVSTNE
jgi:hypothetical protein